MIRRTLVSVAACAALGACASHHTAPAGKASEASRGAPIVPSTGGVRAGAAEPLIIGESFTIDSGIMGEARPINIFVPTVYAERVDAPLPVLYMLDGGMDEDFLHIAGLVQILVSDGSMRPFMLVGIKNTSRRRDLTGPTSSAEDRKIAPVVGGSAIFRRFIREELMPTVRARYRTTDEAAIVGESLAGLFVVETFFLETDLFSTYIAFDPSLWWADEELLKAADARLAVQPDGRKTVFLSNSSEPALATLTAALATKFEAHGSDRVVHHYVPLPGETHATVYHPAALTAFRTVFAPSAPAGR